MIHKIFYILAHKSSAITNKHHCKQLEGLNRGLRQDIDQMIFQNGQVFFYSARNFTRDIFYWRPAKFISKITKIFFDVKTDQQNPTSFLPWLETGSHYCYLLAMLQTARDSILVLWTGVKEGHSSVRTGGNIQVMYDFFRISKHSDRCESFATRRTLQAATRLQPASYRLDWPLEPRWLLPAAA